MDAQGVDRPAAVVWAVGCDLTSALVVGLVQRGYDVHLPAALLPGPGGADLHHPRLHPVAADDGRVDEALLESVRRRGSPLALVVCSAGDDLRTRARLVRDLRGPLRRAGLLVIGDVVGGGVGDVLGGASGHHRGASVEGVPVTVLSPGHGMLSAVLPPRPRTRRRDGVEAARTAQRALDGVLAARPHVVCSPRLLPPPDTAPTTSHRDVIRS